MGNKTPSPTKEPDISGTSPSSPTSALNSSTDAIKKEASLTRETSNKRTVPKPARKIDRTRPDDRVYQLVLVGESGVGKSSILGRFKDESYNETVPPTEGVNFVMQSVMVDNTKIGLEIWDVCGEERTRVPTSYYQGCSAVLAIYDISDKNSFERLEKWIEDSNKLAGTSLKSKWLVGNKIDKTDRAVSTEEAQALAKRFDLSFFEVSAKNNLHIDDLFQVVACAIKP